MKYFCSIGVLLVFFACQNNTTKKAENNNPQPKEAIQILMRAANEGDLKTVQSAVEAGMDINVKDEGGATMLHYATNHYQIEVMKYLILKGADVNAQSNGGTTPLNHAVVSNTTEAVALLLANGANPNIKGSNGLTALDEAEIMSKTHNVELLKKYNAKRGELKIDTIKADNSIDMPLPPPGAKYQMIVYSPKGEIQKPLIRYGIDITETPYGGVTLVVSETSRFSPKLQKFPTGAKTEIIELSTKKVIFSYTY